MTGSPDFYREICNETCPSCPLRSLTPETWEPLGERFDTELDFSEAFKDVVCDATSPYMLRIQHDAGMLNDEVGRLSGAMFAIDLSVPDAGVPAVLAFERPDFDARTLSIGSLRAFLQHNAETLRQDIRQKGDKKSSREVN